MHRIDGANATVDNKFSLGNPGAGIPATTVTADILNALQEEVCGVIEASGIALNKSNNAQLLAAIKLLAHDTGDVKLTIKTTASVGWVMCNDGTIGSASSGATTRAHADTQALYTELWNNISNTHAPVTGGRGVSAADDFAANKPIALTKMLGRALAISGAGSGLTARSLGQALGSETHVLTTAEMPTHAHAVTDPGHAHAVTDPGHSHTLSVSVRAEQGVTLMGNVIASGGDTVEGSVTWGAQTTATGVTVNTSGANIGVQNSGAGAAHNNMPPETFLNAMIKL